MAKTSQKTANRRMQLAELRRGYWDGVLKPAQPHIDALYEDVVNRILPYEAGKGKSAATVQLPSAPYFTAPQIEAIYGNSHYSLAEISLAVILQLRDRLVKEGLVCSSPEPVRIPGSIYKGQLIEIRWEIE